MRTHLNNEIDITLKPSLLLVGLIVGFSMMTCLIVVMLPLLFYIKILMIFIIVISTTYLILRDILLLMPWSWQRIQVNRLGKLSVFNNVGLHFEPRLNATTFIHPALIILNTKSTQLGAGNLSGFPIILMSASIHNEEHRKLRVWLRWWKHEK